MEAKLTGQRSTERGLRKVLRDSTPSEKFGGAPDSRALAGHPIVRCLCSSMTETLRMISSLLRVLMELGPKQGHSDHLLSLSTPACHTFRLRMSLQTHSMNGCRWRPARIDSSRWPRASKLPLNVLEKDHTISSSVYHFQDERRPDDLVLGK